MGNSKLTTHCYIENGVIKTVEIDNKSDLMQSGEVVLWKYVQQKGTFQKHDALTVCLTNFRMYIYDNETKTMRNSLLLPLIDDIVVRNLRRLSKSVRQGSIYNCNWKKE